ncbi:MAG: arsenate reductase [Rhodospirillaceae bacterium]|nr:arsenate reductase [Rhodospirillaceae bacterium]|tara:strand:- start:623 stop:973 length:351 start_codon:yes stop_codon:yes gene_type:complete
MVTVYGIKNCDTCRKALKWLESEGIEHEFHDFRKDGLDQNTVANWLNEIGIETLLNKRGTSWRQLSKTDKNKAESGNATSLLTESPTLIKRPVFDLGNARMVGFSADVQEKIKADA